MTIGVCHRKRKYEGALGFMTENGGWKVVGDIIENGVPNILEGIIIENERRLDGKGGRGSPWAIEAGRIDSTIITENRIYQNRNT